MSEILRSDSEYQPHQPFLVIELGRMFGGKFVETVLEDAELPDDLTDQTVLISGRESRIVMTQGAKELLRLIAMRHPKDILVTHMPEEARYTFQEMAFELELTSDVIYIDYKDIPPEFLQK